MDKSTIQNELSFKSVRSSGPGGQKVNKVSSKVVLSFDLINSKGLNPDEKGLLLTRLSSRLTKDNLLVLSCDETRSQLKNKLKVVERCFKILQEGLVRQKFWRNAERIGLIVGGF